MPCARAKSNKSSQWHSLHALCSTLPKSRVSLKKAVSVFRKADRGLAVPSRTGLSNVVRTVIDTITAISSPSANQKLPPEEGPQPSYPAATLFVACHEGPWGCFGLLGSGKSHSRHTIGQASRVIFRGACILLEGIAGSPINVKCVECIKIRHRVPADFRPLEDT